MVPKKKPHCMRCPNKNESEKSNNHNLQACQKKYPTTGDNAIPANDLWWQFPENEPKSTKSNKTTPTLDLNDPDMMEQALPHETCKSLLDKLKPLAVAALPTGDEVKFKVSNKYDVTKGIMEYALNRVHPVETDEQKQARDDERAAERTRKKKQHDDDEKRRAEELDPIVVPRGSNWHPEKSKPNQVPFPIAVSQNPPTSLDTRPNFNNHSKGNTKGDFALREAFDTSGNVFKVLTNHFKVDVKGPEREIYAYSIENFPEKASRAKRKKLVLEMIERSQALKVGADDFATDYKTTIVSWKKLFPNSQGIKVRNWTGRGKFEVIEMQVGEIAVFKLSSLLNFVGGKDPSGNQQSHIRALNILTAKAVNDGDDNNNTFPMGPNRFYFRPGWQKLGKSPGTGLVAVRGYFSSIKPAMSQLLLNVNTVTSALHDTVSVADFLKLYPGSDAFRVLKGVRVWLDIERHEEGSSAPGTTDSDINSEQRRTKTIYSVGREGRYQEFADPSGKNVTVWDHLQEKYPQSEHGKPTDRAINVGGDEKSGKAKFYMASTLKIVSDQMFKGKNSTVVSDMIEAARRKPQENKNYIVNEGVQYLRKGNAPRVLEKLGIVVDPNVLSIPARKCDDPKLLYGGGNPEITRAGWSTKGMTFLQTDRQMANAKSVVFIFLERRKPEHDHYMKGFLFIQEANGLGCFRKSSANKPHSANAVSVGNYNSSTIYVPNARLGFGMESTIKSAVSMNAGLVVLVVPDAMPASKQAYVDFKINCEQKYGVCNIVMNEDTMARSVKNKILSASTLGGYMGNLIMKFNLRLGNVNHTVQPQHLRGLFTENTCDTLILGVDVTHPGGGSLEGTPSVAAVVGSVDGRFAYYHGSMRRQQPDDASKMSKEVIDKRLMEEMVVECIQKWSEKNQNRKPARILFYRDGVSESQYHKVLEDEVSAIRAAWEKAQGTASKEKKLQITAVVCTKRHHTRFYPQSREDTDKTGNCHAGTCIDSTITSPYYLDFYLQSHSVLESSGKPTHYFTLCNEMKFTSIDLQNLTNALCWTYGRASSAVSYPPPTYYADRLCEKGRQYLHPYFDGDDRYYTGDEIQRQERIEKLWNPRGHGSPNPWHPSLNDKMFWM